MIMGEPDGESEENPLLRQKKKGARNEHGKVRTQSPAPQELLPRPSALHADVVEKYRLRGKLEAVPTSILKSSLWSLKMDTIHEAPSRSPGSGSDEPTLDRSSDLHRDADP